MAVSDNTLKHVGNTSKSEEAEYICGKILCLGAILRSGLLTRNAKSKGEKEKVILECIIELGSKRNYLTVVAYKFVVDYIHSSVEDDASWLQDTIWPALAKSCMWKGTNLQQLCNTCIAGEEAGTEVYNISTRPPHGAHAFVIAEILRSLTGEDGGHLESLWLFLELASKCPGILRNKAIMLQVCGRKKLWNEEFVEEIAKLVMAGNMSLKSLREGPILSKIVDCVIAQHDEGQKKLVDVFWHKHIDPVFVLKSSFKSTVGFTILYLIISKTEDASSLPQYLTKNVIESAIAILPSNRPKRAEATTAPENGVRREEAVILLACFDKLIARAKMEPKIQTPLLKALLKSPGNVAFDRITGS